MPRRYTIEINPDFDQLLTDLADTKNVTKAEIIRRALASYAYLEKQLSLKDNNKISITNDEDKVIKDIILP